MLAVGAIAVVALHGHDLLGHVHRVLRLAEADHVAGARIGLRLAVGHPHAAADHHVVADDSAALHDRDEAEVVREHIDIVVRRQRDGDLEFARQIGAAVGSVRPPPRRRRPSPRRSRSRARRGCAAADGAEMSRASVADRGMTVAPPRIDRRDDVAVDVAAGRDGVQHRPSCRPWISGRRLLLMMPWNWMVCRVVRRSVPLPRSRASSPPPAIAPASGCRPARASAP